MDIYKELKISEMNEDTCTECPHREGNRCKFYGVELYMIDGVYYPDEACNDDAFHE